MRTHRKALTSGQVSAFASAPSGSDSAVAVANADEIVHWALDGVTTVKFWTSYDSGTTWLAGTTTSSSDGEVLDQAARGTHVQIEVVTGTLTAGWYERHRSPGRA